MQAFFQGKVDNFCAIYAVLNALQVLYARRTIRIARQNVWFAIGVKLLVLILAATGFATLWMAVFADVGVTVLAVLNAMRTLRNS